APPTPTAKKPTKKPPTLRELTDSLIEKCELVLIAEDQSVWDVAPLSDKGGALPKLFRSWENRPECVRWGCRERTRAGKPPVDEVIIQFTTKGRDVRYFTAEDWAVKKNKSNGIAAVLNLFDAKKPWDRGSKEERWMWSRIYAGLHHVSAEEKWCTLMLGKGSNGCDVLVDCDGSEVRGRVPLHADGHSNRP
ncbi:hypothetical protein HK104_007111, partial [Borealophlyctis nickersoniae]